MKKRIETLLKTLNQGVYEKETELGMALLTALAGQSILLLGPPGVAKSMVARRLKHAFSNARSFEYLMSRFSTPDEIFGPVSIKGLKESDRYERCTEGYLPSCDVVFLDEIWKAGPAIQNTLLTAINEKTYLNGTTPMKLPLKLLIAASNELPTQGEGLEALWDRMTVRLLCQPIQNEANFYAMIGQPTTNTSDEYNCAEAITPAEYQQWHTQIDAVALPQNVLQAISAIRQALHDVAIEGQDVHRDIYVSDRRWKQIVRLLKASAFAHDRSEVALCDLQIAVHMLWNEPDELPAMARMVAQAIFGTYQSRLSQLNYTVSRELRVQQLHRVLEQAKLRGDRRDLDLIVFDGFYYGIDERAGVHNTYIYATDFKLLPATTSDEPAARGVMFTDPDVPQRRIIRAYNNPDVIGQPETELTRVNLYRDSMNLYVNGVRYPLRRASHGMPLEQASGLEPRSMHASVLNMEQCESEVDELFGQAALMTRELKEHLFASAEVGKLVQNQMESFKKQIALLRADVRKILYGE